MWRLYFFIFSFITLMFNTQLNQNISSHVSSQSYKKIRWSFINPTVSKSEAHQCEEIRSERRCKPNSDALAYLFKLAAIQEVGGKEALKAIIDYC